MEEDLIYQLALSSIGGISTVYAKRLIDHFGSAHAIFQASEKELVEIGEISLKKAIAIARFSQFPLLEKEIKFLEKYKIQSLFITHPSYPQRLLENKEVPCLLFYKGNADLNATRIITVIGTRSPTDYGKAAVERLIQEWASSGALIISGLAYGIDTIVHRSALRYNVPTVGILAHGMDRIYPPENTQLAKDMLQQGGLLTGFTSGKDPETYHFPIRNRIVAALCDACVVAETRQKGGSMLTIHNALSYKKKIFALPGRIFDGRSSGCNALIRENKAIMLTDAGTLLKEMKWDRPAEKLPDQQEIRQIPLFPSATPTPPLTNDEKSVFQLLQEKKQLHIDEIAAITGLGPGTLALPLLSLEWKNLIIARPGKIYKISN